MEKLAWLCIVSGSKKWYNTLENNLAIFYIHPPDLWLNNSTLDTYFKEMKLMSTKYLWARIFKIAALFIISPIWEQPRCPKPGEQVIKLQYIHTIKYLAIKRTGTHNMWIQDIRHKIFICMLYFSEILRKAKLRYGGWNQNTL